MQSQGPTRRRTGLRYMHLLLFCALLASLVVPTAIAAITPIAQGYAADKQLPIGSLVSLKDNSSDEAVLAKSTNVDSLLGVVISNDRSLLSIKNSSDNQIFVATSGNERVLISDINGPIEQGDYITASPVGGVGMKATGNVKVVGIAQSELTNAKEQTYTDGQGNEQTMKIGEVPVAINVAHYFKEPDKTVIPSALQNIANALAGKKVNTLPMLISAGIFVVMIIVVVSIIYSMIKSSIISVGRNPMSQGAIYRDLIQLSALVLVILGVGLSSIYLVLTKV